MMVHQVKLLTSRYLWREMERARTGLASEAVAQSDRKESLLGMVVGAAE